MVQEGVIAWTPLARLDWRDFEAEPHPGEYRDAFASIKYGCIWTIEFREDGGESFFAIRNIRLTTQFVKNLSWVRPMAANDDLLEHVRGCFDLAEETRPRIESKLEDLFSDVWYPVRGTDEDDRKQRSMQDSRVVLTALAKAYDGIWVGRMSQYEDDTRYGESAQMQAKYNRRFADMRRARA